MAQAEAASGVLRSPAAYACAVTSGLVYFVAFPGVDIWPLAFIAFVPLIVALNGQRPRRGLTLGFACGLSMTLTGFYWLLEMLRTFSGFGTALSFLFMTLLCGYQSGKIALLGWLTTLGQRKNWPLGLCFALAFAASELLFPLLFPWYFAGTLHEVPALMQLAELAGPIGVGLTLVAANLALAEPIVARLERRPPHLKKLLALASIPALSAVYGALRIPMVDSEVQKGKAIQAGLVQANLSLFGKREELQQGLERHLRLTEALKSRSKSLDLVVWSETSSMQAVRESDAAQVLPERFTRKLGVPSVFGAVLYRKVDDERRYVLFNSALSTDGQGRVQGRYDKQYLLAFGEYLPLGDAFPILYRWSPNSGHYTPGQRYEALPFGDHKLVALICYEDVIPGFVNRLMRETEGHLLVNLTNDAWFGDTTEPWIHLALAKLRAVEQRRYLIRSTNSGVSAFIDPVGRVLAHTDTFEQRTLSHEVRLLSGTTLYRIIGDSVWYLTAVAALALCLVRRPGREAA